MATVDPTPILAEEMPDAMWNLTVAMAEGPYTPVLEQFEVIAHQGIRDNFTSSATPDNSDWPERKRRGDGHPLEMDTGALLQAAVGSGNGSIEEMTATDLTLGVNGEVISYAAAQNYGREEINLPSREYEGARVERIDEMEEVLSDFVTSTFFGM